MQRSRIAAGVATAASAALLLSACGGSGDSAADLDPNVDLSTQTLTVSNWAGYYPEDMAEKFQSEVGTPLTIANHATNEEIMAKLTAGGDSGIDVAFVSGQFAQALNEAGLIETINPEFVPNLANLYPEAQNLTYDPGNTFSVPYAWGTTGICYRSDLIAEPTSWNAILEPSADSQGKVTALATERWLMLPAQKALGFSANTTDEGEMEQVKAKLIAAKPSLLAYDDTTFYSRLVSGEANAVVAWDGWCNYGTAENPDIKFVIPSEGSDLWSDTMVILKTSKNKEAAHAYINYILDPANHAWVAENILYKVPNKAAMEQVAELAIDFPNMGYTPAQLLQQESLVDLGEAGPLYTRIATEVTSS